MELRTCFEFTRIHGKLLKARVARSHGLAPPPPHSCQFFFPVRANGSNDVTIPSAGRSRKYNHDWANWVASPTFLFVIYSNIWNSFKGDERCGINLITTGSARLRSSAIRGVRPDMKIQGRARARAAVGAGDLNEMRSRVSLLPPSPGRIQKTWKDGPGR